MSDLHQPATDPNQAILERLVALERKASEWQSGQVVCDPAEKRLRLIRGRVNTNPAASPVIMEGLGFGAVRNGTGLITITFTVPFSSVPTVITSASDDPGVRWDTSQVQKNTLTAASVQLQVLDYAGTAFEGYPFFLAIGNV